MSGRGFPSPWTVDEDHDACFIVRDANGQALGYFYFEEDPGRRSAGKLLTKDEARRIAVNFARLPQVATALALTAHEKLGPPFSGPKLEEVRSHGTAGGDGAMRGKH